MSKFKQKTNFSEHGFSGGVTKPYEIHELTDVFNGVLIREKNIARFFIFSNAKTPPTIHLNDIPDELL